MTYTKKQRAEIATAFRAAKKYLAVDHRTRGGKLSRYICYALQAADGHYSGKRRAREIITTRLGGESSVRGYLLYVVGIPARQLSIEKIQAFRHRWLDSLIEEFSK